MGSPITGPLVWADLLYRTLSRPPRGTALPDPLPPRRVDPHYRTLSRPSGVDPLWDRGGEGGVASLLGGRNVVIGPCCVPASSVTGPSHVPEWLSDGSSGGPSIPSVGFGGRKNLSRQLALAPIVWHTMVFAGCASGSVFGLMPDGRDSGTDNMLTVILFAAALAIVGYAKLKCR